MDIRWLVFVSFSMSNNMKREVTNIDGFIFNYAIDIRRVETDR